MKKIKVVITIMISSILLLCSVNYAVKASLTLDIQPEMVGAYFSKPDTRFEYTNHVLYTAHIDWCIATKVTDIRVDGISLSDEYYKVNDLKNEIKIFLPYVRSQESLTFYVFFDVGKELECTLKVPKMSEDFPVMATVYPREVNFDKNPANQKDFTTKVIWNDASKIISIRIGRDIVLPKYYILEGDYLTIRKEFLATLRVGIRWIHIEFDIGFPGYLDVTVTDTTSVIIPENAPQKSTEPTPTAEAPQNTPGTGNVTEDEPKNPPSTESVTEEKTQRTPIADPITKEESQDSNRDNNNGDANENALISLLEQIKITPVRKTLYIGGTKDADIDIVMELPDNLKPVGNQMDISSTNFVNDVTITYKSSKKTVATVSTAGKITAKGIGSTIITTTFTLKNGKAKSLSTEITVKKPYILLVKSVTTMKLGQTFTFQAKIYGFDIRDINWMTTKNSIVEIDKKTGKAIAKSKGTDYVVAKIGNVVKKVKVVVK